QPKRRAAGYACPNAGRAASGSGHRIAAVAATPAARPTSRWWCGSIGLSVRNRGGQMSEQEIRVHTGDGEMKTFLVHPDGDGPYPVAVVYMDAPGYREQLKANARHFAAGGYYCVVPDLFYRSGEGITVDMAALAAANFQGPAMERLMALVGSVKPEMVRADTEAIF